MEKINDPEYFEKKLEVRKKEIKNEGKIKAFALQILTGLKEIHGRQIIHCDMKLPNLLLQRPTKDEKEAGERGVVKICDFGISLSLDDYDN